MKTLKMKPLILLIAVIVLIICPVCAFAEVPGSTFIVGKNEFFKNSQTQGIKMDAVPFVKQGRTFVPVRFLGQSLGISDADIQWNSVDRQAVLVKGAQSVVLTVAKNEIVINGKTKAIDAAPLLKDGRVYLPARFVAEAFDHRVTWDGASQKVLILPWENLPDCTGGEKFGWPVPGHYSISSPFGMRVHPMLKTRRIHTGMDIRAPMGEEVFAVRSGKVIFVDRVGGLGKAVILDHGAGVQTLYAYLSEQLVHVDQWINKGQLVGKIGNSGIVPEPSLHFELRLDGEPVNPVTYLPIFN